MPKKLFPLRNTLSKEQKQELSDRLETLMSKYSRLSQNQTNVYFNGVTSGLNMAFKLVNEISDEYSDALTPQDIADLSRFPPRKI